MIERFGGEQPSSDNVSGSNTAEKTHRVYMGVEKGPDGKPDFSRALYRDEVTKPPNGRDHEELVAEHERADAQEIAEIRRRLFSDEASPAEVVQEAEEENLHPVVVDGGEKAPDSEKVTPLIPEGWTTLYHQTNRTNWETDPAEGFTVNAKTGMSFVDQQQVDQARSRNQTGSWFRTESPDNMLEIRVVFPGDPNRVANREAQKGLNEDERQAVKEVYSRGDHPRIPNSEVMKVIGQTTENGHDVVYYVPESMADRYEGLTIGDKNEKSGETDEIIESSEDSQEAIDATKKAIHEVVDRVREASKSIRTILDGLDPRETFYRDISDILDSVDRYQGHTADLEAVPIEMEKISADYTAGEISADFFNTRIAEFGDITAETVDNILSSFYESSEKVNWMVQQSEILGDEDDSIIAAYELRRVVGGSIDALEEEKRKLKA